MLDARYDPLPLRISLRAVFHSLICLLIVCSVCQPMYAYEQEVNALAAKMAEGISQSGKKTVAVVDFTDLQGNVTELGRFLAEEFSTALAGMSKGFEVIDRTHLKAILQEHRLASTGIIDPRTARRLGQIAGVEALVTGTITPFGDSVRVSVKVLDVSTARMMWASRGQIPKTSAIEELLARGITTASAGDTIATSKTTSAAHSGKTVTATVADLLISVRECRKAGERLRCTGSVTNRGSRRQELNIDAHNSSLIDNLGNTYTDWRPHRLSLSFATGNRRQELEPDLPVNWALSAEAVAQGATSVSLTFAFNSRSDSVAGSIARIASGRSEKVVLRNISLVER